ncbi:transcription factor bHLH10 [Capsella rubella]|uniref:transcription factor bHLH10 n=1 Tax=Capsella rubella TaxID=81985 RepID=UPI000CD4E8DE|nr:transcription factor bHLH10 [Capsella rubella]XP_023640476.1 transcription factor bHLH10 [Capsella rubella]
MEEERGSLYEEMGCFDPNTTAEVTVKSSFSQAEPPPQPPQVLVAGSTSNSNCSVEVEELSEFHLSPQDCPQASSAPLQFHINPPPPCDQFHNNMIHQMATTHQQHSDWDNGYQDFVNMGPNSATTPDLLSLLHLPRCSLPPPHHPSSMLPNSFSDIMSSSSAAAVMYDPLFHLNFPMQPRDHNQLRNGSCLLGVEDQIQIDANGGVNMMYFEGGNNNNDNGGFDNGVLEFNTGVTRKTRRSKKSTTSPTERERRVHFNDRFLDLKKLIPNPTKIDRASIVGEAIDYIKELLRTIEEFKMLVEKKRFGRFRSKKKARVGQGEGEDQEEEEDTVNYKPQSEIDQSCFNKNNNNSLRCSWLKRKSKITEVDVRIIDDEVTIKLVQKKKINCLLLTTKVLDQLQLDLHHVAGGQIGEHYSFLFNTKICEGSCVYASGIADTVMEIVEKQYMEAAVPSNGY